MRLSVPSYVMSYAINTYQVLRPRGGRKSGIPDAAGTAVGQGDLYDLVATLVLLEHFGLENKQAAAFTVTRRGDDGLDMILWPKSGRRWSVNVKTSNTGAPNPHLILKAEELAKEQPDIFIQCIMRIGRIDPEDPVGFKLIGPGADDPYIEVLGWCRRGDEAWEKGIRTEIANTPNGHQGWLIEGHLLRPLRELTDQLADSV